MMYMALSVGKRALDELHLMIRLEAKHMSGRHGTGDATESWN